MTGLENSNQEPGPEFELDEVERILEMLDPAGLQLPAVPQSELWWGPVIVTSCWWTEGNSEERRAALGQCFPEARIGGRPYSVSIHRQDVWNVGPRIVARILVSLRDVQGLYDLH
jgi:hypothetical protein